VNKLQVNTPVAKTSKSAKKVKEEGKEEEELQPKRARSQKQEGSSVLSENQSK